MRFGIKHLFLVCLILLLLIPIVNAQKTSLKEGRNDDSKSVVYLSDGTTSYTLKGAGTTVTASLIIGGKPFKPTKTTLSSDDLIWGGGGGFSTAYQYADNQLKETITLTKDEDIKILLTIPNGYYLDPLPSGGYIIDNPSLPTQYNRIGIQAPYGTDATGKHIPMTYTYSGGQISLNYDRVGITYPLTIDPTFVSMGGYWLAFDCTSGVCYAINIYNTTGSTTWTAPPTITSVEYVVQSGGGAGGGNNAGGGGSAGWFLNGTATVVPGVVYNLTVGVGGLGIASTRGYNGTNSSFMNTTTGNGINAFGGGPGGGTGGIRDGGFPGGGGSYGLGQKGLNVTGYGFAGGDGWTGSEAGSFGGGGSGWGSQGVNGALATGGTGGLGIINSITGSSIPYACGGGAGVSTAGTGAPGGCANAGAGGNGGSPGNNALNGTGSGGGGAGLSGGVGGRGGDGTVILRYLSGYLPNYNSTIRFIPSTPVIANQTNTIRIPIYVQNLTYVKNIFVNVSYPSLWINATKWTTNTTDFSDTPVTDNQIYYNNVSGFLYANISKWHFNTTGTIPMSIGTVDFILRNSTVPSGTSIPLVINVTADGSGPRIYGTGLNTTTGGINEYFSIVTNATLKTISQYTLNLTYKNAETLSILTDAEVSATWTHSGGTGDIYSGSNTTHIGLMNLVTPAGTVTVVSTAPGYKSSTNIFTLPTDGANIIYLVPEVPEIISLDYEREVTFRVKDWDNKGIPDVNISVQGYMTSTGSYDWLATWLSLPTNEAPLNNSYMEATTDDYGAATFLIIPSNKYHVNFWHPSYTFTNLSLMPQDMEYVIYAEYNGTKIFYPVEGISQLEAVNITVTTRDYTTNIKFINVSYNDTLRHTTGGYIDVLQKNATPFGAPVLLKRWPVEAASPSVWINGTEVDHTIAVSGYIDSRIQQSDYGWINRSFPWSFNSIPVSFLGFDTNMALLAAMGIMLFTAMLGGASHATQVAFIVAFEGWIFYAMHWFDGMYSRGVTEPALQGALVLMTVVAIIANMMVRKKKEKY